MSYQVLARKWRPRTFAQMVGQQHVLRALGNALDSDRLHHAYLFTGTRGVGKTTIARILAKCLNCTRGVTAEPCGECAVCAQIDEGRFVDLIEVDAASRARVDETRELLDNVQYAPSVGRYKVYLIDEVHMFSKHSFNALLKTLEEPPPHVKFLLATTDPQRLPITVLSRCLQFNLRRLPIEQIAAQLATIADAEQVRHEPAALRLLARAADGSMRDGLSLLDQAIAYGGGALTEADVRSMLGAIEQRHVVALLTALVEEDAVALMGAIEQLAGEVPDFEEVLADLLTALGRVAVLQAVADPPGEETDLDEELRALAARMGPEAVQLYYQIGLLGRRDLPLAPSPRAGFEMVMLRMLAFAPDAGGGSGRAPASESGNRAAASGGGAARPATAPATRPAHRPGGRPAGRPAGRSESRPADRAGESVRPAAAHPAPRETGSGPEPIAEALLEPVAWRGLVERLAITGVARELAVNTVVDAVGDGGLTLRLSPTHAQLLSESARRKLEGALSQRAGQALRLRVTVGDLGSESPAQALARERAARQRRAAESIGADPNVQAICERFDGLVDPRSILPAGEQRPAEAAAPATEPELPDAASLLAGADLSIDDELRD